MPNHFNFNVLTPNKEFTITQEDMEKFVARFDIDSIIPDRYSWFFISNMILFSDMYGIDPYEFVEEIIKLEGQVSFSNTKPAAMFAGAKLRGLWHKHFFQLDLSHRISKIIDLGKN